MPSEFTRSGVRRAGDDYQDIVALDLFVEMLEHPERYQWARVEADDARFLDDVVALRTDGVLVAKQVKFSAHPEKEDDPYTWEHLLVQELTPKGNVRPSLLSKWGKSLRDLKISYPSVEAGLFSNRRADKDLRAVLGPDGLVSFERLVGPLRESVVAQLDGEENARQFFSGFTFNLDQPDLDAFEEGVERRFRRLDGDLGGWKSLKDELRRWVRERASPPPDGRITLSAIKAAAKWHYLESLPEEFAIPPDFVIPNEGFHANLRHELASIATGAIVLTGPPGIGKSTYISNLYAELRDERTPAIRHHFYLSQSDTTPFRYSHLKVASSLMSELVLLSARFDLLLPHDNPNPHELLKWLSDCGSQLAARGSKLIVLLDGLDHVWRDAESIEELNSLFQILTPIPRGVVLVIGTQPVDASRLPRRLTTIAPRDTWHNIPALEHQAVRRWAEFHADDLRVTHNGQIDAHRLDQLVAPLWAKSEGHPLHLGYLLRSLLEVDGFITEHDIERLPEIPHRDITRYYAHFWDELPDLSKQVLCLLATCDFAWSRPAISECLDPLNRLPAFDASIRQVAHLTVNRPLGLQFAHSSIAFFIREHHDYQQYVPRIRQMALSWLRTSAPDFHRWSFEWLLAAEAGDPQPLLSGPSRAWLIEGMAKCYPSRTADRILTKSSWIALQKGDLERFVGVALLSDYLSEAVESRDYVVEQVLGAQLVLREDRSLLDRLRGEPANLGNLEVFSLAESGRAQGLDELVDECFDRLNSRIRSGTDGQDVYPRLNPARCLARVAAFTSGVTPRNILDWVRPQSAPKRAQELWIEYVDSLRAYKGIERLRASVANSVSGTDEGELAFARLCLLACEERFDAVSQFGSYSADPFAVVANAAREQQASVGITVNAQEPWVLRLKEYDLFQHYDAMGEYFWRLFFVFVANCLLQKPQQNDALGEVFSNKGWVQHFVERSATAAQDFAKKLQERQDVPYSWIFRQFADLGRPDFIEDRSAHGFAIAVRKTLFRLAMDFQVLKPAAYPPTIDADDIRAIRETPLFQLQPWLETLISYRRAWFTDDGLAAALTMVDGHLGSVVEDFGTRAELCAMSAELAATHGATSASAKWVRACWSNLVAYGYHKDMLLDQCLDAVEHLSAAGLKSDALDLLALLAPAVLAVGDYTDGDETRHLPGELGRLLFDVDFHRFVRFHDWLSSSGEYWDTLTIFKRYIAKADLSNRMLRAVAETSVEDENINTLVERSAGGDAHATECLDKLAMFEPVPPRGASESSAVKPEGDEGGRPPAVDPNIFPPGELNAYIAAARAAGSYRIDEDVDTWATVWSIKGDKTALLEELEEYDRSRRLFWGNARLRIDLTLAVKGREAVYDALVVAQTRYGWSRYFSKSDDVRYVWAKLKELHPEKWQAFLQATLMTNPFQVNRPGVTMRHNISRLVDFLLFMGQWQIAKKVSHAAVKATLELVPLSLHVPTWVS